MIPQRRKLIALLGAIVVGAAFLFAHAALQDGPPNGERRGPPWRLPVSSTQSFHIAGSTIQIDFAAGPSISLDLPDPQVTQWIENAATSVATYYGRFPIPRDRILIQTAPDRSGVLQGTTWGDVGGFPAFTRIRLGQHTTAPQLTDDWMMTHELVHTGFPSQDDDHHWIEEGSAVYVEPVARVQAGFLQPEKIWADMVRDMPKGNPQPGDMGLDHTHTWGRTYWGGAQFCLLADVTIREQTHNTKGLQDALRAVVAAGGTIDQDWPVEKAFAAGDAGTGTHVLEEQYDRMSATPVTIDLDGLWNKLGVVRTGTGVRFDSTAPDAAIRAAITATPPGGRLEPEPGARCPVPGARCPEILGAFTDRRLPGACLDDLAGLQAAAANPQPLRPAIHLRLHRVQIHIPAPLRNVVRMRNVVSKLRTLAANVANLCHVFLQKDESRSRKFWSRRSSKFEGSRTLVQIPPNRAQAPQALHTPKPQFTGNSPARQSPPSRLLLERLGALWLHHLVPNNRKPDPTSSNSLKHSTSASATFISLRMQRIPTFALLDCARKELILQQIPSKAVLRSRIPRPQFTDSPSAPPGVNPCPQLTSKLSRRSTKKARGRQIGLNIPPRAQRAWAPAILGRPGSG